MSEDQPKSLRAESIRRAVEASVSENTVPQAIQDVVAERRRQITQEAWSPAHDDMHTDGALAQAAAAYALAGSLDDHWRAHLFPSSWGSAIRACWPASWDLTWFKMKDRRRDLVRAAALLVAEIERLDRLDAREAASHG